VPAEHPGNGEDREERADHAHDDRAGPGGHGPARGAAAAQHPRQEQRTSAAQHRPSGEHERPPPLSVPAARIQVQLLLNRQARARGVHFRAVLAVTDHNATGPVRREGDDSQG